MSDSNEEPPTKRRRQRPPKVIKDAPISSFDTPTLGARKPAAFLNALPPNFTVNDATKNTNKWTKALENGLRLKTAEELAAIADKPPTKPKAPEFAAGYVSDGNSSDDVPTNILNLWDWEEAPKFGSRAFVVDDVKLTKTSRKGRGDLPKLAKSVKIWTIYVRDQSRPGSQRFAVYGADPIAKNPTVLSTLEGGPVDTTICANEEEARELGECVCNLMHRWPYDITDDRWNPTTRAELYFERNLIQSRALDLWRPPFDRTRLYGSHQELGLLSSGPNVAIDNFDATQISRLIRCIFSDVDTKTNSTVLNNSRARSLVIRATISYDLLDIEKLKALPDVPAHFAYKYSPSEGNHTPEQELLLKAFNILEYAIAFKIGTRTAMSQLLAAETAKFIKAGKLARQLATKSKASRPPKKRTYKSQSRKLSEMIPYVFHRVPSGLMLSPATNVVLLVAGTPPNIRINSLSTAMVAHVLNHMIALRDDGKDILSIWQGGVIEADSVTLLRITLEQVKARYCTCRSPSLANHTCMVCLGTFPCGQLMHTTDNRRICLEECAREDVNLHHDVQIEMNVWRQVMETLWSMSEGLDMQLDPFKLKLKTSIVDESEGTWKDMYDGVRSTHGSVYLTTLAGGKRKHPLQLSLDAIHPFIMADNVGVHHHPDNVRLTTLCVNYMKSYWAVSLLPIIAAAARQTQKETNGEQRENAVWTDINNGTDRINRLYFQATPRRAKQAQLTSDEVDDDLFETHLNSLSSSRWSPDQLSPVVGYRRTEPYTAGDAVSERNIETGGRHIVFRRGIWRKYANIAASKVDPTVWPLWTDDDKTRLSHIIDEMQNDLSINPGNLKIPRSSSGAPWPFRHDHMFRNDLDLWDWLNREMLARYWVMFYECNYEHDTVESPDTILLEFVAQWFRGRGHYGYIRCEMTPFAGHPFRASIGRSSHVASGSPMRTGWTDLRPVSSREHYDTQRSTIVIQPWCINMFWHDFPPELHGVMFQLLLDLPLQTDHYGQFLRRTAEVHYPTESRVSQRLRGLSIEDPDTIAQELDADDVAGLREDFVGDEDEEELLSDEQQILQDTLEILVSDIADIRPDLSNTEGCQKWLYTMRQAIMMSNESAFWTSYNELVAFVESGGEQNVQTCCVCSNPVIEHAMLRCSNPDHADALFHFTCVEGLNAMPAGDSTMLCPQCKQDAEVDAEADARRAQNDKSRSESQHRNMVNLGTTCYLSSSVQILRYTKPVFDFISDEAKLIAKPDTQSGRNPREWLPYCYKIAGVPEAQVEAFSTQHMKNAKAVCLAFTSMINFLDNSSHVAASNSSRLFKCIKAVNPEEWKNEMADSAALHNEVFDCFLLVTDDSDAVRKGALNKMKTRQREEVEDGKPLPVLTDDSLQHYDAYVSEGRTSALTGHFCLQTVKEFACSTCGAISRSFEHDTMLSLDLPEPNANVKEFNLIEMMGRLAKDESDFSNDMSRECAFAPAQHPKGPRKVYRRITVSPDTLMVNFKRHEGARLEHVDLPEYLDLGPFADEAKLPSDEEMRTVNWEQQNIYRLHAINMFIPKGSHYVAYILVDGTWLMFDDKSRSAALERHPQAAILEGHVPYYVVYQKQKGKTRLPLDIAGQQTSGHLLSKSAIAPAAKVPDLYEVEPKRSDEDDDGYRAGDGGDDPSGGVESSAGTVKCSSCSRDFNTQLELDEHMSVAHPEYDDDSMDLDLPCSHCSGKFKTQDLLDAHMQSVHTSPPNDSSVMERLDALQLGQQETQTTINTHIQSAQSINTSTTQLLQGLQQAQDEIRAAVNSHAQNTQSTHTSTMQLLQALQQSQQVLQQAQQETSATINTHVQSVQSTETSTMQLLQGLEQAQQALEQAQQETRATIDTHVQRVQSTEMSTTQLLQALQQAQQTLQHAQQEISATVNTHVQSVHSTDASTAQVLQTIQQDQQEMRASLDAFTQRSELTSTETAVFRSLEAIQQEQQESRATLNAHIESVQQSNSEDSPVMRQLQDMQAQQREMQIQQHEMQTQQREIQTEQRDMQAYLEQQAQQAQQKHSQDKRRELELLQRESKRDQERSDELRERAAQRSARELELQAELDAE